MVGGTQGAVSRNALLQNALISSYHMNCGVLLMMQRHQHACLNWMLFVQEFLVMVDVKWSCTFSLWVGIVWLYVSRKVMVGGGMLYYLPML